MRHILFGNLAAADPARIELTIARNLRRSFRTLHEQNTSRRDDDTLDAVGSNRDVRWKDRYTESRGFTSARYRTVNALIRLYDERVVDAREVKREKEGKRER